MKWKFYLLCVILSGILLSCSRDVMDEATVPSNPEAETVSGHCRLDVLMRASEVTSEEEISYPICFYVFDTTGKCVSVSTVNNGTSMFSINLLEGIYRVCAIAGADADCYLLPSKDAATASSSIALQDGKAHTDLMTANHTVTLTDGETNTLLLSLQRKVMLINEVVIENVPSSVKAVSVTIAPLHQAITVTGDYLGGSGVQTVSLIKDGASKTWKMEKGVYCLPSSGEMTVKVQMVTDQETKSYSYACGEIISGNYKLNIKGRYSAAVGVQLEGYVEGTAWEGEKNITFDIDEGGGSTNPDIPSDEMPSVGDRYLDCYVFASKDNGNGTTTLTLMKPTHEKIDAFPENADNEAVKAALEARLSKYNTADLKGWRLMTTAELEQLRNDYDAINDNLIELFNSAERNIFVGSDFYLYMNDDGTVRVKIMKGSNDWLPTEIRGFYLRGFVDVTVSNVTV